MEDTPGPRAIRIAEVFVFLGAFVGVHTATRVAERTCDDHVGQEAERVGAWIRGGSAFFGREPANGEGGFGAHFHVGGALEDVDEGALCVALRAGLGEVLERGDGRERLRFVAREGADLLAIHHGIRGARRLAQARGDGRGHVPLTRFGGGERRLWLRFRRTTGEWGLRDRARAGLRLLRVGRRSDDEKTRDEGEREERRAHFDRKTLLGDRDHRSARRPSRAVCPSTRRDCDVRCGRLYP